MHDSTWKMIMAEDTSYVSPIDIYQSMKHSSNTVSSFKSRLSNDNDNVSGSDSRWNGIHFRILKKCTFPPFSFAMDHKNQLLNTIPNSRSPEMINNRLFEHYYRLVFAIYRILRWNYEIEMNDQKLRRRENWPIEKIGVVLLRGGIHSFIGMCLMLIILECRYYHP